MALVPPSPATPGLVTPSIERIQPYQPGTPIEQVAERLGFAASEVIKLASNENPLGPSARGVAAAARELERVHRYPDAEAPSLRAALAQSLRVGADEVVVSNGSNELLELLVRTFCAGGEHVVFGEPSFVVYRLACLAQGVPFTAVPLDAGHVHDLPAMANAILPTTRIVFIANPNNPTGTYVGEAALERFLRAVPQSVIVVLDEAYCEYADAPDYPDGLKYRALHPRLAVVRTFSKIYGLAGLRVGYAVMPAELAGYIHRVRAPFNVSSVAQAAGTAALGDVEHVAQSRELALREKAFVQAALERLGLHVTPSQANFLLVDVKRPGNAVYDALLSQGVIVRTVPPLPTAIRVTLGTRRENERFLSALQTVIG
jgi:histidinol-phosphate aminotransferase